MLHRATGAIILKMAYGYKVTEGDDPYVNLVNEAIDQFTVSSAPGAFLVDVIPVLRFIPEWFPGAGFQKTAKKYRKTLMDMADVPFKWVKIGRAHV